MINFVIALLIGLYFFLSLNYPDQSFSKVIVSILMGFIIYLFMEAHYYRHRKIEYIEAEYPD